MQEADTFSRAVGEQENIEEKKEKENLELKVMMIHQKFNHRKSIRDIVEKQGIFISEAYLKRIIDTCLICKKNDVIFTKGGKYVETSYVGQIVGIDILHIDKKHKVILAIDYFSRKIFGKLLCTKERAKQ